VHTNSHDTPPVSGSSAPAQQPASSAQHPISSRPAQHSAYQQPASSVPSVSAGGQLSSAPNQQPASSVPSVSAAGQLSSAQQTANSVPIRLTARTSAPSIISSTQHYYWTQTSVPDSLNQFQTRKTWSCDVTFRWITVTTPETTAASPHSFPHSVIHMSGEQIAGNIQHHWNNSEACSSESATAFHKHQRTRSPMPYPGPHDTTHNSVKTTIVDGAQRSNTAALQHRTENGIPGTIAELCDLSWIQLFAPIW